MSVREHTFASAGPPPSLEIRDPAGSVTVTAVEGVDRVDVRVEALDGAAEELLDAVDVSGRAPDGGSPLRVRVAVPERWLFRTPRFAVTVTTPGGTDARIGVASADVDVLGPVGEIVATSASGDVAVERARELQVRSASGDVQVGTATGRAVVGTASGDVRLDDAEGGLEIRTASGDVSVGRATGAVSVGTASGEVRIDATGPGGVRLKSVSGDATIGIVPGHRVWLELSSVSGRLRSELEDEAAGADAADDAGPATVSVTARTVSGDIRILRASPVAAG